MDICNNDIKTPTKSKTNNKTPPKIQTKIKTKINNTPKTPTKHETPIFATRSSKDDMESEIVFETQKGLVELGQLQERIKNKKENDGNIFKKNTSNFNNQDEEFKSYVSSINNQSITKDHMFLILKTQRLIDENNHKNTEIDRLLKENSEYENDLLKEKEYSSDIKSELSANTKEIDCIEKDNELTVCKLKASEEKTDRLFKDLTKRSQIYEKVLSITVPMAFVTLSIIFNFIMKFV